MSLTRPLFRPLFRPLMRPLFPGESWTPLSLFSSGEQGAWYDPSDLTTLFQDSAGTTPVTADGDPVGLMLDKSGNDNHASQSVAAARPIYRTDGTLHWLEFDGVNDFLKYNSAVVPNNNMLLVSSGYAPSIEVYAPVSIALSEDYAANVALYQSDPRAVKRLARWAYGRIIDRLQPSQLNVAEVCSFERTPTDGAGYLNGVQQGSFSSTLAGTSDALLLGAYDSGRISAPLALFGAVVVDRPGNREQVEQYLANKAGITI